MKEYAELIAALRCETDCGDCAYFRGHSCDVWGMMCDAADALEADEQRIAELESWSTHLLKQLPKEGEWIDIDGTMFSECSICGKRHYGCTTPYCDMCGARMRTVTDCHALDEGER